jgi:hypothetical protein
MSSGLKSSIEGKDNTIHGSIADVANSDNDDDDDDNDKRPVARIRDLATVKLAKILCKIVFNK